MPKGRDLILTVFIFQVVLFSGQDKVLAQTDSNLPPGISIEINGTPIKDLGDPDLGDVQIGQSASITIGAMIGWSFGVGPDSWDLVAFSLIGSPEFAITSDTCPTGKTLYALCSTTITFKPTTTGLATATFQISSEWSMGLPDPNNPGSWVYTPGTYNAAITFTGTGVKPGQSPTDSSTSCNQTGSSSINMDTLALSELIPLVGAPFRLNYSSDRFRPGFAFSPKSLGLGGWSPSILHHYDVTDQILYDGDGGSRPVQAGTEPNGYYVASQDAHKVYYFDLNGNHLYTKDALTGVTIYSFSYDPQGRISAITDRYGNVTTFQYSANQVIMTSPYGQQTIMNYDSDGFLSSVTNPNSETYSMTYDSNGYLLSFEKPSGETSHATYDSNGYVLSDLGAGGDSLNLSSYFDPSSQYQTVNSTTALGRTTFYYTSANSSGSTHEVSYPTGQYRYAYTPNIGAGYLFDSEGISTTSNLVPDPRFGAMSPYDQDFTYSVANSNIDVSTQKNVTATLSNSNDPLSLTSLTTTTELQNDPSRTSTETYTAATSMMTNVSPLGRETTTSLNSQGEVQSVKIGSLVPIDFGYNGRGNLTTLSMGSNRNMTLQYDEFGNVASVTNFLGQATQFEHDKAGRVTEQIEPNGNIIKFGYDPDGDLTSVTPPSRPAHEFGYNLFDLVSSYLPPELGGSNAPTKYSYNADKQLTAINLPTGATISYNYASTTGLLDSIAMPDGNFTYSYVPYSNLVSQIVSPDNETLSYQYAGKFVTSEATSGPVTSNLAVTYNADGTVASITPSDSYNVGATENISYDKDGLVVGSGNLSMTRNQNGQISSTSLKNINESITHNAYGEMTADQFTFTSPYGRQNKFEIFNQQYTRDKLGRVVAIGSARNDGDCDKDHGRCDDDFGRNGHFGGHEGHHFGQQTEFVYDNSGNLVKVIKDNHIERIYKYDQNGNRIEEIADGRIIHASYNSQDELVKYGNISYQYNSDGELTKKTVHIDDHDSFWDWLTGRDRGFDHTRGVASWGEHQHEGRDLVTTYSYDAMGELKTVKLPDGRFINYIYDGQGRRVGKEINGKLVEGFMYQSQTQLAAVLDGQGHIVKQFVYGSKPNIPDYMIMNGKDYRIISNQVGTPLYVVNAETGKIVERERMDVFGYDEHTIRRSMLPFGFAGGLADADTGLVHFGARDYDPQTGHWVSRDPILFNGGTTNLYQYSLNDPVNFVDPSGQSFLTPEQISGIIGGAIGGAAYGAYYGTFVEPGFGTIAGAVAGGLAGATLGGILGPYVGQLVPPAHASEPPSGQPQPPSIANHPTLGNNVCGGGG